MSDIVYNLKESNYHSKNLSDNWTSLLFCSHNFSANCCENVIFIFFYLIIMNGYEWIQKLWVPWFMIIKKSVFHFGLDSNLKV